MPGQIRSMSQTVRRFWSAVAAQQHSARAPAVVLHDPAAQRAHDLDDPFFDYKVQSRIGDIIAAAGNKH